MKEQIVQAFGAIVLALLAIALVVIPRSVNRYISARAIAQATGALVTLAKSAVAHTEQTYVLDLKAPGKPGEWNDTAARAAQARALNILRVTGRAHIATLEDEGMPATDRQALLETLIEEAVANRRVAAHC